MRTHSTLAVQTTFSIINGHNYFSKTATMSSWKIRSKILPKHNKGTYTYTRL